jgi:lipopolysaccharide transport system ATP-binding protein
MKRAEIERKFDEIVAFAEIERFLDTPVKHYSTGMYLRLAFAVAAHLEPEILLVDEVLAVGDAEFQKKCLGKMDEVARGGRTVLFVSHNMGAIATLTERVIWIDGGRLQDFGPTKHVIARYVASGYRPQCVWTAPGLTKHPIQIMRAEIISEGDLFDVRASFRVTIEYIVRKPTQGAVVSVIIHAPDHTPIMSTEDVDTNPERLERRAAGTYRTSVTIPGDWLSSGTYLLRLHTGVVYQEVFDDIQALQLELVETGNPKLREHKRAYLLPYLPWTCEPLQPLIREGRV